MSVQLSTSYINLFKQILRPAYKIKRELEIGNHAPKVKSMIKGEQYYMYISQKLKRDFRTIQRQVKNKSVSQEEFDAKVEDCKYIIEGLESILKDLQKETHKKNALRKNQNIIVLNAAVQGWGNPQYHEKLLESFINVNKYKNL